MTFVAYYGQKSMEMEEFIRELQHSLPQNIGFTPRPLIDIHMTVSWIPPDLLTRQEIDTLRRSGELPPPLQAPLREFAEKLDHSTVCLQFGSFDESEVMRSRGKSLHERSFSIMGDKAVLMGWPTMDGHAEKTLAALRSLLLQSGIDHQYREVDGSMDADAYMVVGDVHSEDADETSALSSAGQTWLASHQLRCTLSADDLSLVVYSDRKLPMDSCTRHMINSMLGRPSGLKNEQIP